MRAISDRRSGVKASARAGPPFKPPSRPSATAAGCLVGGTTGFFGPFVGAAPDLARRLLASAIAMFDQPRKARRSPAMAIGVPYFLGKNPKAARAPRIARAFSQSPRPKDAVVVRAMAAMIARAA